MLNPSQEPPTSSKASNQDWKYMDVFCNFKVKIESQNSELGFIKDKGPYPNQNKMPKPCQEYPASSKSPNQDLTLLVPLLGFRGCWRFLTGIWHCDLDLAMVNCLWYTNVLNFVSLSVFWRYKEHPCPLSPDLELWFLSEVWHLDHDLDIVTCLWKTHDANNGSLSWLWMWKEHPCPLSPDLELWRMLEVPGWGFES